MNFADLYKFCGQQRAHKSKSVVLPLLADKCEVLFKKGVQLMFYKCCFDLENTEVDFLKPKFDTCSMPAIRDEPRVIPASKKSAILKLMTVVPNAKRKF